MLKQSFFIVVLSGIYAFFGVESFLAWLWNVYKFDVAIAVVYLDRIVYSYLLIGLLWAAFVCLKGVGCARGAAIGLTTTPILLTLFLLSIDAYRVTQHFAYR